MFQAHIDTEDAGVNKTDKISALMKLAFYWEAGLEKTKRVNYIIYQVTELWKQGRRIRNSKLIFKQILEKGVSHKDIWRKCTLGKKNRKDRDPEVGGCQT